MNGVDWLIVLAVLLSITLAASQGFFFEVFSLAGVVVGYLLAAWEYTRVSSWLSPYTRAQWVADAAGFLIIFLAVVLLAGMAGRITRWAVKEAGLRWFDRVLCAIFGFVRGVLLVSVILLSVATFAPSSTYLRGSNLAPYFLVVARAATWVAPSELRGRFRQGMDELRKLSTHAAIYSLPKSGAAG